MEIFVKIRVIVFTMCTRTYVIERGRRPRKFFHLRSEMACEKRVFNGPKISGSSRQIRRISGFLEKNGPFQQKSPKNGPKTDPFGQKVR